MKERRLLSRDRCSFAEAMVISVLLLSPPFLMADTYHSGDITSDETWYAAGNPHIVSGDVKVINTVLLTIEAGCQVKFDGDYHLMVDGTLVADGTETDHIAFTSNQSTPANGDWEYIIFNVADGSNLLDYCDISYGGSLAGNGSVYFYNQVACCHRIQP